MLGTSLSPQIEDRVYRVIIENMASLDVDIKIKKRKGTHLVRSVAKDKHVLLNNIT